MTNEDLKRFYHDHPNDESGDFVRLNEHKKIPAKYLPAGGEVDLYSLIDLIEGSDEIIVDVNEAGDRLIVKLDEDYKNTMGIPSAVEFDNFPETATQGNLTEEQLVILQHSENNYIMFNHEKFYLMDIGHTEGFLTYGHIGVENNVFMIKAISITISTRAWKMLVTELTPNS